MIGRGEMSTEGVDERRLAHPGNTGDTHPMTATGVREQSLQEFLRHFLVIGPLGFDQGDGSPE